MHNALSCRRHFGRLLAGLGLGGLTAALAGRAAAQPAGSPRGGSPQGGSPQGATPGEPRSTRSHVLETGAAILQSKAPLDAMSVYLDGFHFYADDMGRQVEAHHYCTHLNEDFHQCVIFDSNDKGARLIGVEYIVSERLFRGLPDDEKRLWHSHHYEVKSGALIAPGLPEMAERAALTPIVSTYGKTFHTWQIDRDALPLGIPQLMMGFTADGQINPALLRSRDERFRVSSDKLRQARADIPMPTVLPGANAWESGTSLQTGLQTVKLANRR